MNAGHDSLIPARSPLGKRLRTMAARREHDGKNPYSTSPRELALLREAADELDRLSAIEDRWKRTRATPEEAKAAREYLRNG